MVSSCVTEQHNTIIMWFGQPRAEGGAVLSGSDSRARILVVETHELSH